MPRHAKPPLPIGLSGLRPGRIFGHLLDKQPVRISFCRLFDEFRLCVFVPKKNVIVAAQLSCFPQNKTCSPPVR